MTSCHGEFVTASPFGVWDAARLDLVSYRHLGCSAVQLDRDRAVGRLSLRGDMRTSGGLLSAPIAIAMLDAAGICIDRVYQLGLTHVEVQLVDSAADVRDLHAVSRVVRWARTQLFTEATFVSAAQPDRILGIGTADWAVIAPTPEGFVYTDPSGPAVDESRLPPLAHAYDARPIAGGYEIGGLSPRIGTDTLHHGPILVALEATALDLAGASAPGVLSIEHSSVRIVKAGRSGPFRTAGSVVRDGESVLLRAVMIDHGNAESVVAVGLYRLRRSAPAADSALVGLS